MSALDRIAADRLIAILRRPPPGRAAELIAGLVAGGVGAIEITLDAPDALAWIAAAREAHPGALIGAGTVRSARDALDARKAGAQFTVAPTLDLAVTAEARESGVPHVPGCLTPTEAVAAMAAGAELVKLFPAGRLGPGYVRDLLGPLPELRLVVTGGIAPEQAAGYLAAGAIAVGLGSSLLAPDVAADGDVGAIAVDARRVRAALQGHQGQGERE